MSTLYEKWNNREIENFGSFQTTLFQAYRLADSSNRERLNKAFFEWFEDEPKEVTKYGIAFLKVLKKMKEVFPTIPGAELHFKLVEFSNVHRPESVIALYGFMKWVEENKNEDVKKFTLIETFTHDVLNGSNDEFLLPRSSSYLKFAID